MSFKITYDPIFMEKLDKKEFSENFTNVEFPKLQQAAEVHGYRGSSKKKHNGIVPIRPSDKGLLKSLSKLVDEGNKEMLNKIKHALPIKVVAHVPTGNRLVGYLFEKNIYIYGVANYDD